MKANLTFLHNLPKEKYLTYLRALPNFHEEKIQSYAAVILTLLAISFFGIFAISPTINTIVGLRKTLADSTFVVTELDTKISNLTRLQNSYNNTLSPQLPYLYNAVPQTSEVGKLSGQIRTLATNSSVILDQLQIQSTQIASSAQAQNTLEPISLNIGVRGNIQSFTKFYNSLVDFDRIVTISSLSLSVPTELDTLNYRLSIQAQAYYRP
ncbi:MAG TPA: type 4a pilus biogenesis protein PilO [Patescibacteria group bacterium]|nr:type 4a pilus biogenesis protein PilO [Patescibacteria group bacterium]